MPSDPSLPPYPPQRVWSFPPPPVRRGWFWAAVTAMIVSVAAVAALGLAAVSLESTDAPGLIDDADVLDTIAVECERMTAEVERTPDGYAPMELAAIIREQNEAVTTMVENISNLPQETLRADRPTLEWLRDWGRLVATRDAYATVLETADRQVGPLDPPKDAHGDSIVGRMDDALLDPVCEVPDALLEPGRRPTSSI